MPRVVIFLVSIGACTIRAICHRRAALVIENSALREQLAVLKKERPGHRSRTRIERFGLCFDARGSAGRVASSSAHRGRAVPDGDALELCLQVASDLHHLQPSCGRKTAVMCEKHPTPGDHPGGELKGVGCLDARHGTKLHGMAE